MRNGYRSYGFDAEGSLLRPRFDPMDHIDYTGTVQGDEFVARMIPIPDIHVCGSSATLEGKVVGLISNGGRHLDATEVDT